MKQPKRTMALPDFLTEAEITEAMVLWQALKGTGRFAATVEREIITPVMDRINAALGQENDARYLAYAVEYVMSEAWRDEHGQAEAIHHRD